MATSRISAALLEAMLERETVRALGQLAEVLPSGLEGGSARQALLAALRGYLEVVRADPVTWRLVLMPPEGTPELLREDVRRGREAVVAVLAQVVDGGVAAGLESPDPHSPRTCCRPCRTRGRGCCSRTRTSIQSSG